MTLTLEIAPDIERALEQLAQANGQDAADYAATLLAEALREAEREVAEDAAPKPTAASVRGKYAIPGVATVDEFLAERHAEAQASERA